MKEAYIKITIHFLILLLTYLTQIYGSNDSLDLRLYATDDFNYLISGGKRFDESIHFVRYMVSIRTQRPQKYFGDNHFCAGTIIGPRKIITAAHCVTDKRKVTRRPRTLMVVAGTPNRLRVENTTRQFTVDSIFPHMNFIRNNTDDIALLFLTKSIPEDDQAIQIMPLPTHPPPYNWTPCGITGWGRLYKNGPLPALVVGTEIFLFPKDVCTRVTAEIKDEHKMLCAAARYKSWNYDNPCVGDNGGPLICNGSFTGVVSYTVACGNMRIPTLYTDVYSNLDWIRSHNLASYSPIEPCLMIFSILIILIVILS